MIRHRSPQPLAWAERRLLPAGVTRCLAAVALSVACGRGGANERNASPVDAAKLSASATVRPVGAAGAADSTMLTMIALPEPARTALRSAAPAFTPFDPATYPADVVASAHRSADEGLVVIRADLQGVGRIDFAIAGTEGDSLRVLALFQQPDGRYRLVEVYSQRSPPYASSLPPGVPPVFLERAPCEFRCGSLSAFTVVPRYVGDHTGQRPARLAWVEERHRFFVDEPLG